MMPEALGKHFAAVKKRRDEKYGGSSDGAGEIENPVQNAAADALVVGD